MKGLVAIIYAHYGKSMIPTICFERGMAILRGNWDGNAVLPSTDGIGMPISCKALRHQRRGLLRRSRRYGTKYSGQGELIRHFSQIILSEPLQSTELVAIIVTKSYTVLSVDEEEQEEAACQVEYFKVLCFK
jgi:hypothetical protein